MQTVNSPSSMSRRSSSTSSTSSQQRRRYLASLVGGNSNAPGVTSEPMTASSATEGGPAPFSVSVSYTIPKRSRSGPASRASSHPAEQPTQYAIRGGEGLLANSDDEAASQQQRQNNRCVVDGSSWTTSTTTPPPQQHLAAIVTGSSNASIASTITDFTATTPSNNTAPQSTRANITSQQAAAASAAPPRVPQPPPRRLPVKNPQSMDHTASVSRKSALRLGECAYDGNEESFLELLMDRLRAQCAMVAGPEYYTEGDRQYLLAQEEEDRRAKGNDQRALWEMVEARNRPSLLRRIPMELLLVTCEYLNVVDLCRFSGVSRKVQTVLNSPLVWIRHCKRYRLPLQQKEGKLEFVLHPRQVVVDYLVLARRTLDERLVQEQQTLEALEQRLNSRAAEVAPFSQTFMSEHQSSSTAATSSSSSQAPRRLVQLIQQSEKQLTDMIDASRAWETARLELQRVLLANRDALRKQQGDVKRIQKHFAPNNLATTVPPTLARHSSLGIHSNSDDASSAVQQKSHAGGAFSSSIVSKELLRTYGGGDVGGSGTQGSGYSSSSSGGVKGATAVASGGIKPLTASSVEQFERKLVRTVLSAARDLPVVIRRGTTTFSALELLSIQLQGGSGGGGAPSPVATMIAKRWKAMKQFFPLTSADYGSLCDLLLDSDEATTAEGHQVIIPPPLSSCASLLRRILTMTDDQLAECAGL
ncbi:Hypothetical protein, putative [Bodo saltans]|uniref:F-box domain-containing protein n=1 Tax=Bodo saltans TaxID=75058 RepID=A0A0S4INZ4_BODSA|nr:Hypothetical protein, putative [Bodo saltans]|eukprot:CUE64437.1 Hypothetical protein, putative [Bodo saltans]